jgi:glycosyltransferase involved in cell wall biosynthesis
MKILIISPVPTHPSTRGNSARILYIAGKMMEWGHEVWFLHTSFQAGDERAMAAWWGGRYIHHAYRKPWRWFRFLGIPVPDRWHHGLLKRGWLHQRIDQLYDRSLDPVLRELQGRHAFDAVLVEYVSFSRALLQFGKKTLKLIDTHDIYADRHKRLLKAGVQPEWFFLSRREERKGLMRADRVMAIQDVEEKFFRELLGGAIPVKTVGHFPPLKTHLPSGTGRTVTYLGANSTLNVRSIQAFVENVWPLVVKAAPELELHIWGGVADALTFSVPRVFARREVADVAEAYEASDIVINPMIAGTGLKIKTIEALAHGCPVVASPVAVEGLPLAGREAGVPWLVAATPQEWVASLLKLAGDSGARREMSAKALEYARAYVKAQEESMRSILEPANPCAP